MPGHRVGIIGCGNISAAYLKLAPLFTGYEIAACADIDEAAARRRAEEFGIDAKSPEDLLADDSIDCVINLTIPAAHSDVTCQALEAGKHVYSEKPLALSLDDGKRILELAESRGLRVGCAPDTFLGGAHQAARAAIDAGRAGEITSGSCHVMGPGMESWHPNPDFFFQPGAGPVLDIGPYYVANLINLIGPVRRVAAMGNTPRRERVIGSEPRRGERIEVNTPTTLLAVLEMESGAVITLSASWDVQAHRHANMELYGSEASIYVPDPNFFNGEVLLAAGEGEPEPVTADSHPLQRSNWEMHANYRSAGLADMLDAVGGGRPHRCSLEVALHSLDVMLGILESARSGGSVRMSTSCSRPEPFDADAARSLLDMDVHERMATG